MIKCVLFLFTNRQKEVGKKQLQQIIKRASTNEKQTVTSQYLGKYAFVRDSRNDKTDKPVETPER